MIHYYDIEDRPIPRQAKAGDTIHIRVKMQPLAGYLFRIYKDGQVSGLRNPLISHDGLRIKLTPELLEGATVLTISLVRFYDTYNKIKSVFTTNIEVINDPHLRFKQSHLYPTQDHLSGRSADLPYADH